MDRAILDGLREKIRPLRGQVRQIYPRTSASLSLVAADGGNNQVQFDPFLLHIIRVVDSSANEYCLEAITTESDLHQLSRKHLPDDGRPQTALGEMMAYLGVRSLGQLSPFINTNSQNGSNGSRWIPVYRDLIEWAVLFSIVRNKDFGTDTILIRDGLLRCKTMHRRVFHQLMEGIDEGIRAQWTKSRRRIYIVGLAKSSKVLSRYRLAMYLESVLTNAYPSYVEIPREIEESVYKHVEYARGEDVRGPESAESSIVGGKMFFVKFGCQDMDPIWPVDIWIRQRQDAQAIIGHLLADALNGFPIPLYPLSLQRAHESAALGDFDFDMLQDMIIDGLRKLLGSESELLDRYLLMDRNIALQRYGREGL